MLQHITQDIKAQVNNHVLGQEALTELAVTSFVASGHILIIGPTGIGKTKWAKALAEALGLPYDSAFITETSSDENLFSNFVRSKDNPEHFVSQPGALFSPVFHADFQTAEYHPDIDAPHGFVQQMLNSQQFYAFSHIINAMDRYKSGLMDFHTETFILPETQFIIASCNNPNALPKALTDRFMMKLYMNYPGVAAEKQLLINNHENITPEPITPICTPEIIAQAKQEAQAVEVEDAIFNYIISIVETTRRASAIQSGASPRAGIALLQAAKAYAAINGRDNVTINDVQRLAIPILRHRICLNPGVIKEGIHADRILESIILGKN